MTTYEHAMLGINGVVATGLQRKFGWQLAAIAAVAAIGPDWDGLTFLFSMQLFDSAHRVWGHNLFACLGLGVAVGWLDYRFDLVTRCARCTPRSWIDHGSTSLGVREEFTTSGRWTWLAVATLAAFSQLPADLVVSGTASLDHWELQLLWPLSDSGWVYPLIPWGDPGVTIIFAVGMLAMARWSSRIETIARLTLGSVATYLIVRGFTPL